MATRNPADSNIAADTTDLRAQLNRALAAADSTTGERVQQLQQVHQARTAQLSRTAVALKTVYGAEDARVQVAAAAVSASKVTSARAAMMHQQITTTSPKVSPNGWALHGRVFDADMAPAPGYTVFLVDAAKTFQQAYGFAYTDDTGYFLLNYEGPDAAAGKSTEPGTAATATSAQLFVEVADRKQRTVYLSSSAFIPVVGGATYQNIVLTAGDPVIGVPPVASQRTAAAKRKKKS